MAIWPRDFKRVLDERWLALPVQELAKQYDSVEDHSWYDNLNPTIDRVSNALGEGERFVDYSGGTGILLERFYSRIGQKRIGALIADSSPKFLRLAYEKFKEDPRVAFRQLHFDKETKRLERLDSVIDAAFRRRGFDVLVSTNAVHLYQEVDDIFDSWRATLRKRGRLFLQSGNISNPDAPANSWIIDETVAEIARLTREIVQSEPEFKDALRFLGNEDYLRAHDDLRQKYFLPTRTLSFYTDRLEAAQLFVTNTKCEVFEAKIPQWNQFLSVYHEGIIGWVGGAQKVTGEVADSAWIEMRRALIERSLGLLFEGQESFNACWTYIDAVRSHTD